MKRKQPDIVDKMLDLSAELRKRYRIRQTVAGPVPQPIPEKAPPRGANRKNLLRRLRTSPKTKPRKEPKVARLIEHTERDSAGREITRYFGDPGAWLGQFSHNPPRLVEPHGAARDAAILQMHAAGLSDQQIAASTGVNIKTVERALLGKRLRPRTRRTR